MDAHLILKYVMYANDTERQGVEMLHSDIPLKEQLLALFGSEKYFVARSIQSFLEQMGVEGTDVSIFYEYGSADDTGFDEWLHRNVTSTVKSHKWDISVSLDGDEYVRIWYFC